MADETATHVHVLRVRDHRIRCEDPVMVAGGFGHDAIALDLDAEWDGLSARLVLGPCGSAYDVLYEDAPVVVPAATLAEAGWLPVSVVGHGGDGAVRVTTERCDHLLRVVESGCVDGSVPPEDQPDLLGQLVEAAERADASADAADKAAASATSAASAATEAAGEVDAAVESATKAAQSATDAATAATDAAERADQLAEDIPAYVTAAQQAAVEAARAASEADGAATAAGKSASAAAGSAEQATGSATAAQSSATDAAGSASEAASSATQAAQSAQQVADKYITGAAATTLEPGEQATAQVVDQVLHLGIPQGAKGDKGDTGTGVPEGGEPGQLLSKTDSSTAWVDPPSTGNVLKGTATGNVAHAEDAYAQKPIEVRVKGRTLVNRWPVINGVANGITVATDGTDLVTVTGTATDDADIVADVSGWATGKSYTATISVNATGCNAYFEVQKPSGNTSINASTTGATLNVASDATKCVAGVHVASGATVNASFRVMLVEGSDAPDCFTPTGLHSVEPTKLVTAEVQSGDSYEDMTETALPEVELRSLPNGTCDELVIGADGTCEVERETGTFTFNGSENWAKDSATGVPYFSCRFAGTNETTPVRNWGGYNDRLLTENPYTYSEDCFYIFANGNGYVARLRKSGCDDVASIKEWLASNNVHAVYGTVNSTEPQSPVTLPQLPAPTFNAYHDSQVPSDTTVTYERDVTIAFEQLEAKIAALTVAQATS